MIKDNQKSLNRFHVVLDAFVTAFSYLLAWFIVIGSGWANLLGKRTLEVGFYFGALLVIIPAYLLLYSFFGLYTPKRVLGRRNEFGKIFKANTIGLLIFGLILYFGRKEPHLYNFSQRLVVYFYVLNVAFMTIERNGIRIVLRSMRSKGYNQKHILLVGYSSAAEGFIDRVNKNPEWGYTIRGIIDDTKERGSEYKGVKVIGCIEDLDYILEQNSLDEIAVTLSLSEYEKLRHIVALCEKSGVHTKFIPDYNSLIPGKPYTEDLGGLPVINIRYVPLSNTLNAVAKRAVDIVGSLCGLIVTSPLLLIVAILIRATSKGPIIFSQERIGRHNHVFKMYKFRSMYADAEERKKELMAQNEMNGLMFKMENDPRITKTGDFLRKTSLDEFPQFINILKGDMSLVGTRPPTLDEFAQYSPYHKKRLIFRPGLTGMWQVSGRSDITDFEEIVKLDVEYIDNWSFWLDIKILLKTFLEVFTQKGAR